MIAEILCVGSELLLGDIADTHTRYLAQRLSALGINLHFSTSVGDNQARIVDCLSRALARSDIVLTTGGLGPTDDDLTRESIAELFGETPIVDEAVAAQLRDFFARRGIEMTDNNLKQASLISSARAIPNERGTAPGWWATRDGRSIIAMPGPPGEMQYMWETQVEPRLISSETVIRSRTLKLFNISESKVDTLLSPLTSASNPTVAVYAKQDGIHIRITAKAVNVVEAVLAMEPIEATVRERLGDWLWGTDDDTQESVVARMLQSRGLAIAISESITAGHVASLLASTTDNRDYFRGATIFPYGGQVRSEKEDCVQAAMHVLERFNADIGLAVCGGVLEGEPDGMNELVVTVVWPTRNVVQTGTYRARAHRVRSLGAYYALDQLRKVLSATT
ncbi:MAG: CinA family nicotinamide mononucleotide deamidase-related protein [Dehalococcoidia bacterium]|nr:CinA family nicotinamide mononucleotide deamidase-related protein [Dehalococcoidia bacterium]